MLSCISNNNAWREIQKTTEGSLLSSQGRRTRSPAVHTLFALNHQRDRFLSLNQVVFVPQTKQTFILNPFVTVVWKEMERAVLKVRTPDQYDALINEQLCCCCLVWRSCCCCHWGGTTVMVVFEGMKWFRATYGPCEAPDLGDFLFLFQISVWICQGEVNKTKTPSLGLIAQIQWEIREPDIAASCHALFIVTAALL